MLPVAIVGIGIDLVSIPDFAEQVDRPGTVFAETFTPGERRDAADKSSSAARHLAARWAAKEAVIKALGHYLKDRPPLNVIQVSPEDDRRHLRLPDDIGTLLGDARCLISISYNECHATAIAVFTEEK